jgi:hypothetical protein
MYGLFQANVLIKGAVGGYQNRYRRSVCNKDKTGGWIPYAQSKKLINERLITLTF